MAGYNAYFPVAYPGYGNYYPQAYQPAVQPQQIQTQPQQIQNQNSIIWVSGLVEAQSYPVAPNYAVALWEQSGKTIYLKSADATGKPSIRIYDLVERTEPSPSTSGTSEGKTADYATKEELGSVAGALKGILNDIEQMKGDLYGMAGRKKPVKKTEVEEDDT